MLTAAILGLVEGLTEFLPVSSTGHLILAGHFLKFTGEKASTFEIFIQFGAILAVVMLYGQRFVRLIPAKTNSQGFSGFRGLFLLGLTTLPALVFGFLLHSFIKERLFNPKTVALGLFLGAIWILVIEKIRPKVRKNHVDEMNYKEALGIGFFQCLAMWPGISRAGATILGAMMLGLDRKAATEYSFFAAVPVIFAASFYDLLKSLDILTLTDMPLFAAGFIVSFFSAWIAVKGFIAYLAKHDLKVFAWYRIVLAGIVLMLLQ